MAEIGLIGTAYGKYNLHLGGDRLGMRLNRKFRSDLDEGQILRELDGLFNAYAQERGQGETFGDYITRKEIV